MSYNDLLNVSVEHPTGRDNFTQLWIGSMVMWFSYKTLIAFRTPETGEVISENCWSTTTGKHINHINPDKDARTPRAEFEALAGRVLVDYALIPEGGNGMEPMLGGK